MLGVRLGVGLASKSFFLEKFYQFFFSKIFFRKKLHRKKIFENFLGNFFVIGFTNFFRDIFQILIPSQILQPLKDLPPPPSLLHRTRTSIHRMSFNDSLTNIIRLSIFYNATVPLSRTQSPIIYILVALEVQSCTHFAKISRLELGVFPPFATFHHLHYLREPFNFFPTSEHIHFRSILIKC